MAKFKVKTPRRELKFLLAFVLVYTVLHFLYFLIPNNILRDVIYYHGIVAVSAEVINFVKPGEQVFARQNQLSSSKAVLEIVRGCDGVGAMFLVIAAVLAFSASFKAKLLGALGGVCLLFLINQLRVVGLYFVVAYQRDWFLPIHTYFAPTLIVIISCLFFAGWAFKVSVKTE